jgi:uncharacterized membrane protein
LSLPAYATVFGQPLALFGFLAYTSMVIFALAPSSSSDRKKELRSSLENWTWLLLLAGAIAMSVFSGYLMYLLAFKIKALCLYCLASALFSLSLLVMTIIGRAWEDVGQIIFTGIVVGMVTLIGTGIAYAKVNNSVTAPNSIAAKPGVSRSPSGLPTPGVGWAITTSSGPAEIALARYLKQIDAKEYAWWCPIAMNRRNCLVKRLIVKLITLSVPKVAKCIQTSAKQLMFKAFPLGKLRVKPIRVQSLEELAQNSGYTGPRNFKNFTARP